MPLLPHTTPNAEKGKEGLQDSLLPAEMAMVLMSALPVCPCVRSQGTWSQKNEQTALPVAVSTGKNSREV